MFVWFDLNIIVVFKNIQYNVIETVFSYLAQFVYILYILAADPSMSCKFQSASVDQSSFFKCCLIYPTPLTGATATKYPILILMFWCVVCDRLICMYILACV